MATHKEETTQAAATKTTNTAAVETAAPSTEKLIEIATELNTVLGLNPPIDVTLADADLLAKIILEATNIGMGETGFDEKVWEADKAALAPETLAWLEANGALAHVTAGLDALKAAAPAAAAPRAAAAPAAAAPRAPAYSRMDAMIDALKAGGTAAELIAAADANLIAKGKKAATASIKADLNWLAVIMAGVRTLTIDKQGKITVS
jgi:hypothetical protein